jgi:hypothetical protein
MTRNWAKEPETRLQRSLQYRTKYGQGRPRPDTTMVANLRNQEAARRTELE